MLVLSRKKDEKIVINDNIIITVVEVRGDKVKIGVDAPQHVPVHRKEVYEVIHRQVKELVAENKQREAQDDSHITPPL